MKIEGQESRVESPQQWRSIFSVSTALADLAGIWDILPPMRRLHHHSNLRTLWAAVILWLPLCAGGCALWDKDRWNLNHYRDERAVDIDRRLERHEPIVKNPF
jgi:hypothetical protein